MRIGDVPAAGGLPTPHRFAVCLVRTVRFSRRMLRGGQNVPRGRGPPCPTTSLIPHATAGRCRFLRCFATARATARNHPAVRTPRHDVVLCQMGPRE